MLIHEKGPFIRGSILLISFLILFFILLTPVMHDEHGKPVTGLQYADNVFNELSKGSSYFIPGVRDSIKKVETLNVNINVKLKKPELGETAVLAFQKAGAQASFADGKLSYQGNLGALLASATDDADRLYHNDADSVSQKYGGENALKVARAWWYALSPSIKELQKQSLIADTQVVDPVIRRAIEPGNNFFSVTAVKVADHIWLMSGMLIFYVLYTLWYGFSIFELFEGIGLAMTKSKVKQEG